MKCRTCGGDGEVQVVVLVDGGKNFGEATARCPVCDGSGRVNFFDHGPWRGLFLIVALLTIGFIAGVIFTRDSAGQDVASAEAKVRAAEAQRDEAVKELRDFQLGLTGIVENGWKPGTMVTPRISQED